MKSQSLFFLIKLVFLPVDRAGFSLEFYSLLLKYSFKLYLKDYKNYGIYLNQKC